MNLKHLKHKLVHYLEQVPDRVRARKWLVWALVIGGTVLAIAGVHRTRFDFSIEGWFAEDDPAVMAMDEFHARFGSDDNLYIVYEARDGNVFSTPSLQAARALRRDLLTRARVAADGSPLKHIVKITTLENAPVLKVEGDALVSRNLVGSTIPTSRQALDEIARTAETQRSLPLQYFSKDHRYGGILVETNFGTVPVGAQSAAGVTSDTVDLSFDGKAAQQRVRFKPTDMPEYVAFMNAVKVTLDKPEFAGRFEYHPVGNPASTEYNIQVLQEMGLLYLAMMAIMVAVLWFVFRSFSGVLWPALIVILSAVWTIGLFGWLGVPFTAFLILTVAMILVIGISDSIHILSGYEYFREKGEDHQTAMRSSFHSSANACFLTAITGIIGILSIVSAPIIPLEVEGFSTSVGIAFAFIFTMYVLPLMVDLWWAPRKKPEPVSGRYQRTIAFMAGFVPNLTPHIQAALVEVYPFVRKYRYLITAVSALALTVCLYGMLQLKVDTNPKSMFPRHAQIRDDIDIADRHMEGSQMLEIYFDFGTENALYDPVVLRRMDALQNTIETRYSKYVIRTLSVVDVVKSSYKALNEDRPEMYTIPPTRQLAANTFFMFDNSNPIDRRKMVSDDYSKAHIGVYLRNGGSYEYTEAFESMQKDIDAATADLKQKYPKAQASVTGTFTLTMQASDYVSWNALQSFGWATLVITVVLLFIFASAKAGLISVAANAVPVTLTFGLMGLLGVPLDFTTVLIAPIVIGLAVDDTVHFLSHYRHEVSRDGDMKRALVDTIKEAGQAVTFTSLILVLGLSVLGLSSSPGNANVGIYGALSVFVGWVCEILLTPALILVFGLDFRKKRAPEAHPVAAVAETT